MAEALKVNISVQKIYLRCEWCWVCTVVVRLTKCVCVHGVCAQIIA